MFLHDYTVNYLLCKHILQYLHRNRIINQLYKCSARIGERITKNYKKSDLANQI